jgi:hypothetical protein
MNTTEPNELIGPKELSDELIRHRLITAATDNRLAIWQEHVKFKSRLGFDCEPHICDSCFRLASALGRRDMVGFEEEGFGGELLVEMLGPAVIGGSRSVVRLLQYWQDLSPNPSDQPILEIQNLVQGLLEARIDLQGVITLFQSMKKKVESDSTQDDRLRLTGELVLFESFVDDVDRLINEHEELAGFHYHHTANRYLDATTMVAYGETQ